MPLEN